MEATNDSKSLPLHTKIFIGMLVGVSGGLILQNSGLDKESIASITKWVKPVGDIFLRMIFMMVIPLILSALTLGIADLGDLKKIGRVGLRTLVYTLVVSAISVVIGITTFQVMQPGKDITPEDRQILIEQFGADFEKIQGNAEIAKTKSLADVLTAIIPKNPVEDMARAFDPTYSGGGLLALMFFSLMLGIALSIADQEKVAPVKKFLEGVYEIVMIVISIGMKLAPYGVAALLFNLTANMGFSVLKLLLSFVMVVILALSLHMFGTYSLLLRFWCKMKPSFFFSNIQEVMLTAFSTSSSNATLPTAIRVCNEKLKIPRDITNFVLTIGSTANQNGTALYEGITVLFLAQCFGVDLTLTQQIFVVVMSILGGVGTAGVPGGSLPIIMLILVSVGVPGESIMLIYGVDRILDMCRTVLNVTGDLTAAVYVNQAIYETNQDLPKD